MRNHITGGSISLNQMRTLSKAVVRPFSLDQPKYETSVDLRYLDASLEARYIQHTATLRLRRVVLVWILGWAALVGVLSIEADADAQPIGWGLAGAAVLCTVTMRLVAKTLTTVYEVLLFWMGVALWASSIGAMMRSWNAVYVWGFALVTTISPSHNSWMFRHGVGAPFLGLGALVATLCVQSPRDGPLPSHLFVAAVAVVIAVYSMFRSSVRRRAKFEACERSLKVASHAEAMQAAAQTLSTMLTATQQHLAEAQSLVNTVMAEGGSLMHRCHIDFDELQLSSVLGQGGFGTVWQAEWRTVDVAVKRVLTVSKTTMERFMHEIQTMAALHHPHLVRLLGACWKNGPDQLAIVLEYCSGGTLGDWLIAAHSPPIASMQALASCCRYLHHELAAGPLIHRDIKPANILMDGEGRAKLADFGEARQASSSDGSTMTIVGTPIYCAPEILRGAAYGTKVDVYAFAFVLFDVGCVGSVESMVRHQVRSLRTKPTPTQKLAARPGLWPLIVRCWDSDPDQRPTFQTIYDELCLLT